MEVDLLSSVTWILWLNVQLGLFLCLPKPKEINFQWVKWPVHADWFSIWSWTSSLISAVFPKWLSNKWYSWWLTLQWKSSKKTTYSGLRLSACIFAASLEQLFIVYTFSTKAFSLRLSQKHTWLTCLWLVELLIVASSLQQYICNYFFPSTCTHAQNHPWIPFIQTQCLAKAVLWRYLLQEQPLLF